MGVRKFYTRILLISAAVLLSLGGFHPTYSQELYVSPRGNDAQPGTASQPCQTLQHAVTKAQPGDTIFLQEGNYPEDVHLGRSGASNNLLTLAATAGEQVTVRSLVVEPGVSYLQFKDLVVKGYKNWGIEWVYLWDGQEWLYARTVEYSEMLFSKLSDYQFKEDYGI